MGIFICKICQKECKNLLGLRSHSSLYHNIKPDQIYVDYVLNGVIPKCECGCGGNVPFISIGKGFSRFIRTHHNRVPGKNNFHKNPESKIKSAKTQSENWNKGMYRRWWEEDTEETKQKIEGIKEKLRNNKERGKKISEKLKGVPKTEESKLKLSKTQKERLNNLEIRKKMSNKRLLWMRKNSKVKTSNLESKFESILDKIGLIKDIDYIHNHLISEIKTFFDFYLPNKKILIETDGDFYHCNPNTIFATPKYEIQKKNLSNDKRKNSWCKNHNITLLRYWEKDINERPEWVISDLKDKLGI